MKNIGVFQSDLSRSFLSWRVSNSTQAKEPGWRVVTQKAVAFLVKREHQEPEPVSNSTHAKELGWRVVPQEAVAFLVKRVSTEFDRFDEKGAGRKSVLGFRKDVVSFAKPGDEQAGGTEKEAAFLVKREHQEPKPVSNTTSHAKEPGWRVAPQEAAASFVKRAGEKQAVVTQKAAAFLVKRAGGKLTVPPQEAPAFLVKRVSTEFDRFDEKGAGRKSVLGFRKDVVSFAKPGDEQAGGTEKEAAFLVKREHQEQEPVSNSSHAKEQGWDRLTPASFNKAGLRRVNDIPVYILLTRAFLFLQQGGFSPSGFWSHETNKGGRL